MQNELGQPEAGIGLEEHSCHCNCGLCHLPKFWQPKVEASRELSAYSERMKARREATSQYETAGGAS